VGTVVPFQCVGPNILGVIRLYDVPGRNGAPLSLKLQFARVVSVFSQITSLAACWFSKFIKRHRAIGEFTTCSHPLRDFFRRDR
jgi:hypothetical protein